MKTEPNEPINPTNVIKEWNAKEEFASGVFCDVVKTKEINYAGLTKREYFAAMAMQGLLANTNFGYIYNESSLKQLGVDSLAAADALIHALNADK